MMTATEETHRVPMNLLQDDEDNTLPEAEVDGSIDPDTDEELEDEDDEFEDDDEEDEDDEDEEEGDDVEEEDDEDVVDDETDDEDDEDADVPVPPTSTRL